LNKKHNAHCIRFFKKKDLYFLIEKKKREKYNKELYLKKKMIRALREKYSLMSARRALIIRLPLSSSFSSQCHVIVIDPKQSEKKNKLSMTLNTASGGRCKLALREVIDVLARPLFGQVGREEVLEVSIN